MKCSICGNVLEKKFSYGKIPLCDSFEKNKRKSIKQEKYDLTFMGCNKCFHLELKKKVDPKKIYIDYPYYSAKSPDLEHHFDQYSKYIKKFENKNDKNYHLDIGCNDGILIKKTKKNFNTFGVEPGKTQAILASKHGKVFNNFMSYDLIKSKKLFSKFNVVTTSNTIANIKNLDDFVKAVSASLKDRGIFIVETLNLDILFKNKVYEMFNHEHFHYFSQNSLIFLANKYNLVFKEINFFKTKGATMRIAFKKSNERKNIHLKNNKQNIIKFKYNINNFLITLNKLRERSKFISSQKKNKIGGFGSSQGTTILVYLLGLEKKIKFVTDDNKSRHGYFVPGTTIKVLPPKEFHKLSLNYTFVFAWRFMKLITKKHKSRLNKQNKLVSIFKI